MIRSLDDVDGATMQAALATSSTAFVDGLVDRMLGMLEALRGVPTGFEIDMLEHSLQTADRAVADGAGVDLVVAALVHDIADPFAKHNHGAAAAAIVEPYLDEEATWVVRHHTVFQQRHYALALGLDPDAREHHRGSPHFDACAAFCAEWDQRAFDPSYRSAPLGSFAPVLQEVFGRAPYGHRRDGDGVVARR